MPERNMRKPILLILSFIFLILTFHVRAEEKAYLHAKTGIILPLEIEGLLLGEKHVYDEPGLGESVPYNGDGIVVTLYIYNMDLDDLKDDPNHTRIKKELSNAIGDVKGAEELGVYARVKIPDAATLLESENNFSFLSIPISYDQVQNMRTREAIEPLSRSSLIGMGIYKNHFIKLRYSFEPGEDQAEKEKQRDAFINSLVSLVREVDVRAEVKTRLATYLKDPLSDEGRDALGGIVVYAEKSELVQLTIHSGVMPWVDVDDYPYSSELLGAYIAGQVQYQLSHNDFTSNENAGRNQVVKVYEILKKTDENAVLDALEDNLEPAGQP